MKEIDIAFFEEYKRLDKLCSDILNSKNGVSEYITQMEETMGGSFYVPSWNEDYKTLKHLRWVRNQIAHDISGGTISNESDITAVREFYDRILSGEDPFTKLRKVQARRAAASQAAPIQRNTEKVPSEEILSGLKVFLTIIAIVLALMLIGAILLLTI